MLDINKYDVIICPNYIRNSILNNTPFINKKFMTYDEFILEYVYKYKSSTLLYIVEKYNLIPSNAKIILNNLYYIDKFFNDKTKYLLNIKNDLIQNGYIIFNNNFKTFIKKRKILIIDYSKTKYFTKILIGLNYGFYSSDLINKKYSIYEFKTMEDEVIFIASKIVELINNKIDINDIKVSFDKEYINTINKIFTLFNIPFEINNNDCLYLIDEVKKFYENIPKDININELKDYLDTLSLDISIYNKIVSIINKYIELNPKVDTFYDTLIYELKNTYLTKDKYIDCISITDVSNELSKYMFILGFNQNIIPKVYKDEDYLSDSEKSKLGIDTSYDNNIYEKEKILNLLNRFDNLFITYKLETPFNKYNPSSLIDELDCEIIRVDYNYSNSNINKLLYASKLDDLIKYNIKDNILYNLYSNTIIPYNTYSNLYTNINLKNFKVNLSTTNMEQFFKCKYSFYINSILKLATYEETTSIKIGNLFHKILEVVYRDNLTNYEEIIDKYLNEYFKESSLKQNFYNKKYKEEILKLIEIINKENTNFKNTYFEEWFSIDRPNDLNIKIVGKIDKIMTLNDGINTYVVVIDYKTGGLHYDFNKVIYGLDSQLLMYLYLIKKTNKVNNCKFAGMYLMPILYETLKAEKNKTYDELISYNTKLCGYSNSNLNVLNQFDKNLDNSFIKGIKLKKDNSFYAYSKVLTDNEIDSLLDIVESNIDEVIKCIKTSDFKINPKRLGKENISCTYCKFKDICYMTNNDIVNLKEYKNLEFLNSTND